MNAGKIVRLRVFLVAILWLLCHQLRATADTRPNIVLIMADDIGLGDIGIEHKRVTGKAPLAPTPMLDELARTGLWFTDAHSPTALCSPSRYCVMSGNYCHRSYTPWGVWQSFRRTPLTKNDATLGTVTRDAGYRTGFIGKWHLGGDFKERDSSKFYRGQDRGEQPLNVDARKWVGGGPQDWGFDYDFTLPTGVQGPFYVAYENSKWSPLSEDSQLIHLNKHTAKNPRFVSDKGPGTGDSAWDTAEMNLLLADKAAAFIRNSAGKKPFFLCYWTPAVHVPHLPPEKLGQDAIKGTTPTRHLDMNRVLDWEVEQIINALKETGEYENTMLIFTSDNGGLHDRIASKSGHNSNGGWRGNKNSPHEGGHRVPFIVSWPGVVEPGRSDELVCGTDAVATIAATAGSTLSDGQAQDSWNLHPLLQGDPGYTSREEMLLQGGSRLEVIYRQGPWKLIIQADRTCETWTPKALFNLTSNPLEQEEKNLISQPTHKSRVDSMLKRYLEIRSGGPTRHAYGN